MKRIIKNLDHAFFIKRGEVIQHPTFGRVKVVGIYKVGKKTYEGFCLLLDFNGTQKVFNMLELSRLKFKTRHLKVVK